MRHAFGFIAFIFVILFFSHHFKSGPENSENSKPILKVFASSSFISQWGPGPRIKENFEKICGCSVEYFDGSDNQFLLRRLQSEGEVMGADVVMGLDQNDLEKAKQIVEWNKMSFRNVDWDDPVKGALASETLLPYDWGALSFIVRKSEFAALPKKLNDFLDEKLEKKIVIPDPRTSSVGLQFLLYLIQVLGEDQAFGYLKKLEKQILTYPASWSQAYGLFQKEQAATTFSYVTSSIYHLVEEKTKEYVALELQEGHPVQFEFLGIPAFCKNCELALSFVEYVLSHEGQKIVMEKNYMMPAVKGVVEGTPFANLPRYKLIDMSILPQQSEKERILKRWSDLRKEK